MGNQVCGTLFTLSSATQPAPCPGLAGPENLSPPPENTHLVDPVLRLEPRTVPLQSFNPVYVGPGRPESEGWGNGGGRGRMQEIYKQEGWGVWWLEESPN